MIKNIYAKVSDISCEVNSHDVSIWKKYIGRNCGRYKNSVSSENAALQVCIIKCPVIKY